MIMRDILSTVNKSWSNAWLKQYAVCQGAFIVSGGRMYFPFNIEAQPFLNVNEALWDNKDVQAITGTTE